MKKALLVMCCLVIMICGCTSVNTENKTKVNSSERDAAVAEKGYQRALEDHYMEIENSIPIISSEASWAYDITNPAEVFKYADFFLRVKITDVGETKYFVENTIMPSSTYRAEVIEVLESHDKMIPQNINLASKGGIVTMKDYVSTMDEGTKKKTNVEKLSDDEQDSKIMINDESYYELQQGKEYYILVKDLTEDDTYKGYYGLPEGGYDVFELLDGEYINVLTKQILKF